MARKLNGEKHNTQHGSVTESRGQKNRRKRGNEKKKERKCKMWADITGKNSENDKLRECYRHVLRFY